MAKEEMRFWISEWSVNAQVINPVQDLA